MTEPEPLQQIDRTFVRYRRRKLSYYSGCDYFRLASHPRVMAALQTGVKKYGLNVAASRLTTGNHALYRELETRLVEFFDAESALLVPSGYATNLITAQALAGNFSHALIDERAHTSLADAARLLDCPVLRFKSRDAAALAQAARRCGPAAKLVVLTDGMFSGDGSAAPLAEYLALLPRDAMLVVDDAHGAGVLGRTGRGTLEHAGVSRDRIIQTITLSKALGSYGGAILCSQAFPPPDSEPKPDVRRQHPPAPPAGAGGANQPAHPEIHPNFAATAVEERGAGKTALRQAGLALPDAPGPIIPLLPRHPDEAARLSRSLFAAAIFPPFLKYPGGPPGGCFRFVISSEHNDAQLDNLIQVLRRHLTLPPASA